MKLRVIDALQLPEVLTGKKWMALELPTPLLGLGGWNPPPGFYLPQQTIGIDPDRKRMYWCDGHRDPFGSEAALQLPQLLGRCTLIDPSELTSLNSTKKCDEP